MPKNYEQIQEAINAGNKMDFGNAMIRNNGVPLDSSSVHKSYIDAVIYAATNGTAYAGQTVTVIENDKTLTYVITTSPHGKLRLKNTNTDENPIYAEADSDEEADYECDVYLQALCTGTVLSRDAVAFGKDTIAGSRVFSVTGNITSDGSDNFITFSDDVTAEDLTKLVGLTADLTALVSYTDGEKTYTDMEYLFPGSIKIRSVDTSATPYTATVEKISAYGTYGLQNVSIKAYRLFYQKYPNLGDCELGEAAYASGKESKAYGYLATARGSGSRAIGNDSVAEGYQTYAATYGHAEGTSTKAYGRTSHAEGKGTAAHGWGSHTEGLGAKAYGAGSHAEGKSTVAGNADDATTDFLYNNGLENPVAAHAEGNSTKALGASSHAEGYSTTAEGAYSHAEGSNTSAKGGAAHAEGVGTIASSSKAYTITSIPSTGKLYLKTKAGLLVGQTITIHANKIARATIKNVGSNPVINLVAGIDGLDLNSNGLNYFTVDDHPELGDIEWFGQHVQGKYNVPDTTYAHIVGNGSDDENRSNAYTLDWGGNATYAGKVYSEGGKELAPISYVNELMADVNGTGGTPLRWGGECGALPSEAKAGEVWNCLYSDSYGDYGHFPYVCLDTGKWAEFGQSITESHEMLTHHYGLRWSTTFNPSQAIHGIRFKRPVGICLIDNTSEYYTVVVPNADENDREVVCTLTRERGGTKVKGHFTPCVCAIYSYKESDNSYYSHMINIASITSGTHNWRSTMMFDSGNFGGPLLVGFGDATSFHWNRGYLTWKDENGNWIRRTDDDQNSGYDIIEAWLQYGDLNPNNI